MVNSDHHITASESLSERVESVVTDTVDRYSDRITRVEVHLQDVNGASAVIGTSAARWKPVWVGVEPVVVTAEGASLQEAIDGAADKLERALEHAIERLQDLKGPAPREVDIADAELLEKLEPARDARH